jgi:hypothetical protein
LPEADQRPEQELLPQLALEDSEAGHQKLLGKQQPLRPNQKRILGLFPNLVLQEVQTTLELQTPMLIAVKLQLIFAYAWLAKPGGEVPLLMGSNLT